MELYALALLPFGLLSLWFHRNENHRATAGFGFLAALAPVLAKGIGSLISHKQGKSAAKQAEEQKKLEAQQADALAKQQWEAQMNSPQAQAARYKNTLQYGRLAAGLGGLDKVPKSMAAYYNSARTMPEYSGVSSYVPQAEKGGGGWDFAAGLTDALSYLDTSKLGGGSKPMGQTPNFASTGGGSAAPTASATNPLADYINRSKSGYKPFDPKLNG